MIHKKHGVVLFMITLTLFLSLWNIAIADSIIAPPMIPQDFPLVQEAYFARGEKYAVYTGPGEEYARSGNGNAVVSTNDWIQVFGKEDEWIMIQYAINKQRMRIGWIPEISLRSSSAVNNMNFSPQIATILMDAQVTDDPLCSQAAFLTLPKGATVYLLDGFGEWAYIETFSGDTLRGYISQDAISIGRIYKLENCPTDNGLAVLKGNIIITKDCAQLDIVPTIFSGEEKIDISCFHIYDTFSGTYLFTISKSSDHGTLVGSGGLPNATTSICIVAELMDQSSLRAYDVRIEW